MRINEQIRVPQVRLIDSDGTQLNIVATREAQRISAERGLDLVEIAPQAKPPVCKIMDYGKYRFEQVKREKETKKNQKVIAIKEVKLRPNIEDHDFETKAKNGERFLKNGNKVKVTIMFRGREITHPDLGRELCARMAQRLGECSSIEKPPKVEGRNMNMILVPKSDKDK
ncbi:MAG: translation initiation factor IF-3 [Bacillota bacterium]